MPASARRNRRQDGNRRLQKRPRPQGRYQLIKMATSIDCCFVFNYFYARFLALFSSEKKTLMYSPCPSVCELIFSRTMRHTEPKFSASLRLNICWKRSKFGSFPTMCWGYMKNMLKTDPHNKADETTRSLCIQHNIYI